VDEIGGLDAAIKYAAKQADMGDHYKIVEYPRSKNLSEAIAEFLGKYAPVSLGVRPTGFAGQIADRVEAEFAWMRTLNDPQGVYARMPVELVIH
jgi:protease-4